MGVVTGCGCKEVYRFPHITYHYSSCTCTVAVKKKFPKLVNDVHRSHRFHVVHIVHIVHFIL